MRYIYLLLGSNLGDRKQYLANAVQMLSNTVGPVIQQSSLYQTSAWGNTSQPDFINQVIYCQTGLDPYRLMEEIISIENSLGRERVEKWGSRTIDIDILFYGNEIIHEKDLVIPHPHLHERRFTLAPLAEIAPQFIHPVFHQTITELYLNLDDNLQVKKLTN
ncbi:MAG: 2-amino-4-hydroxy-6-hydroxymethyldihydropteridine diphosphokinase [Daejeonella sp.]